MYLSVALEPNLPRKLPEGWRVKLVSGVTIENVNLERWTADQAPSPNFSVFRVSYSRVCGLEQGKFR